MSPGLWPISLRELRPIIGGTKTSSPTIPKTAKRSSLGCGRSWHSRRSAHQRYISVEVCRLRRVGGGRDSNCYQLGTVDGSRDRAMSGEMFGKRSVFCRSFEREKIIDLFIRNIAPLSHSFCRVAKTPPVSVPTIVHHNQGTGMTFRGFFRRSRPCPALFRRH